MPGVSLCWVVGLDATSAFIVTQGSTCWEPNGYKQTSKGRYKKLHAHWIYTTTGELITKETLKWNAFQDSFLEGTHRYDAHQEAWWIQRYLVYPASSRKSSVLHILQYLCWKIGFILLKRFICLKLPLHSKKDCLKQWGTSG